MRPPSKESTKAWLVVVIFCAALIAVSLAAGYANGPSRILSPSCTNSAFAQGIC